MPIFSPSASVITGDRLPDDLQEDCFIETSPRATLTPIEICHSNYERVCPGDNAPPTNDDADMTCTSEYDVGIIRG